MGHGELSGDRTFASGWKERILRINNEAGDDDDKLVKLADEVRSKDFTRDIVMLTG
jgi:hypothetical protein